MQNKQDSENAPGPLGKLLRRISIGVALAMGVAALVTGLWFVSHLRSFEGRDSSMRLPWEGQGIVVKELSAHWRAAGEDSNFSGSYYPIARLKLGDCDGNGLLFLTFHDEYGRQVGDMTHLPYHKGQFNAQDSRNIKAGGKTAVARINIGKESRADLDEQLLDERHPLWRVVIRFRPEGDTHAYTLGYICVKPEIAAE